MTLEMAIERAIVGAAAGVIERHARRLAADPSTMRTALQLAACRDGILADLSEATRAQLPSPTIEAVP